RGRAARNRKARLRGAAAHPDRGLALSRRPRARPQRHAAHVVAPAVSSDRQPSIKRATCQSKAIRPDHRRPLRNLVGSGSDRSGNPLLQLLLRRGADLARSHLAAFEDHQGRDRHHAIFRGRLRALVDVELHDLDLLAHRAGDLVERGSNHAARATPFGPEIDDDRPLGLEHFSFEIGVRNLANGHGNTSYGWRSGARESRRGAWLKRMNRMLPGQAWRSPLAADASSASSAGAEISMKSVLSVQSRAARMARWG